MITALPLILAAIAFAFALFTLLCLTVGAIGAAAEVVSRQNAPETRWEPRRRIKQAEEGAL